jgi:chemotaxis protein histidine kinase CheA
MGGTISIESEVDKGTTFTLIFKKNNMMLDLILCVDDDPITLMLCKSISKTTFSNEIVTAQNGEEALQYLNSIKPKRSNFKNNLN